MKKKFAFFIFTCSFFLSSAITKAETIESIFPSVGIAQITDVNIDKALELYKWKNEYKSYKIPKYKGFKSWESYKLFGKKTKQYALQQYCYSSKDGMRMYENRYCVAISSSFKPSIGQYFDLILKNGTIIPCVCADVKSIKHMDQSKIFTTKTQCCSEFIVDSKKLNKKIKQMGDVSYLSKTFKSPVVKIKMYNKNKFIENKIWEVISNAQNKSKIQQLNSFD